MEFGLAIVTVLALLLTLGMGLVTWRIVREERRRSTARLAALAAELERQTGAGASPTLLERTSHPLADADIRSTERADPPPLEDPGVFQSLATSGPEWTRRLAGVGVAALVLAAVVSAAIFAVSRPHPESPADPRTPVELLGLKHVNEDGMLAITGRVRNPTDGPGERQLSVLAMAFDDDGVMVASGRAPLAVEILAPGLEATFAVTLPAAQARRYRISFLVDDTTVPHIDLRPDGAMPGQTES